MKKIHLFTALVMLVGASAALAQTEGKVSGYMFGDYYYVAGSPDSAQEDLNGFWFRRIYLTYDKGLENDFSMRLRFEMSSPGDFSTKSKMTTTVKDAYLEWKRGNASWYFGISSSPMWGSSVEKIWGYRAIEKTPADLQKFASSRDFGVAVKGKLGSEGKVFYHLMAGNGAGNSSETNKHKKVMGAVGIHLTDALLVEAYADYEGRPNDENRTTYQGFAAYQTEDVTVGAQFVSQTRDTGPDSDMTMSIASGFVRGRLREHLGFFARYDAMLDANPDAAKISYLPFATDAESNFVVVGLDWAPAKDVHIMPNVEVVAFNSTDDAVDDPDATVLPRVTVFYKF